MRRPRCERSSETSLPPREGRAAGARRVQPEAPVLVLHCSMARDAGGHGRGLLPVRREKVAVRPDEGPEPQACAKGDSPSPALRADPASGVPPAPGVPGEGEESAPLRSPVTGSSTSAAPERATLGVALSHGAGPSLKPRPLRSEPEASATDD